MADTATAAVRSRAAARGWINRTSTKLANVCKQADISLIELNDAMDEFDRRLATLDMAQNVVEETVDLANLDNEIKEASEFRETVRAHRIEAAKILAAKNASTEKTDNESSVMSLTTVDAKLPQLELPTFSGDVSSWTTFWEQFTAVVHNGEMPDIAKFTYLLSLLTGEAKAAVRGLALTAANYKSACDILVKRLGRPERIIFSHVQELLTISVPWQPNVSVLWKMFDELQAHVRSLDVLGINGKQYSVVLTPLILSRLPPELRVEWAREGEKHESDLEFLLTFLRREIKRRERSQTFLNQCSERETTAIAVNNVPMATASALHSSSDTGRPICGLCHRPGHTSDRCFSVTKAPINDRKDIVRNAGACYRCLSTEKGHRFNTCNAKCAKCKGKHHAVLCGKKQNTVSSIANNNINATVPQQRGQIQSSLSKPIPDPAVSIVNTNVSNNNSVTGVSSNVLLQAARVIVHGKYGNTVATMLFDTGSDKTYVSKRLVDTIVPEWIGSRNLAYANFGSDRISSAEQCNLYSINLQGTHGNTVAILATEIPINCPPLCRPSVPHNVLASFGPNVEFIDVPVGQEVRVDILVGLDFYWKLMTPEMLFLPDGLVAQRSVFGWVLSGPLPVPTVASNQLCVSYQLFCTQLSDSALQNVWDLDAVGIGDKEIPVVDPVLTEFNKQVTFCDGRYVVALPWKAEEVRPNLLNNEKIAMSRLASLTHRLSKDLDLASRYHMVFCEMRDDGIIEEVPDPEICEPHTTYYMPHRPVVKEGSRTTKVRPVFDASAKGFNGTSLNDCLETGPSLIPDLPGILLCFRRWMVALSTDVTKAFHQIMVRPEDRDVHRFLWDDNRIIRKMWFLRVPFGNKSSPFLLNATIKHHLAQFPASLVKEELSENLYVDDWLSGCDDDNEGCEVECHWQSGDQIMIMLMIYYNATSLINL